MEYGSDIREALDELESRHGEERFGDTVICDDALVELRDTWLSFDTGRMEGLVRAETPRANITLRCREMRVEDIRVVLVDQDGNRSSLLV